MSNLVKLPGYRSDGTNRPPLFIDPDQVSAITISVTGLGQCSIRMSGSKYDVYTVGCTTEEAHALLFPEEADGGAALLRSHAQVVGEERIRMSESLGGEEVWAQYSDELHGYLIQVCDDWMYDGSTRYQYKAGPSDADHWRVGLRCDEPVTDRPGSTEDGG